MNTYGYIRVSTKEQNENRRRIAMAESGVAESNIILDKQSGTNFERPDFKRMIDDIEAGRINTVIVKDLSRFGREYAEMGMYIEHYFEEKGVRFLPLAENIDSQKGLDSLVLPFTNVINSFYARQASSKTKAAHRARAKAGMYLGSHAPFGYVKAPADRHHLIVDPPAADVVRDIFQMFANGVGYVRMTKILRERGILNPQAYFNQNNPDYFKSEYWRKPYDWHAPPSGPFSITGSTWDSSYLDVPSLRASLIRPVSPPRKMSGSSPRTPMNRWSARSYGTPSIR